MKEKIYFISAIGILLSICITTAFILVNRAGLPLVWLKLEWTNETQLIQYPELFFDLIFWFVFIIGLLFFTFRKEDISF